MSEKVEEILKSLSLDEKIRLLNGVGSWDTFDCGGKVPVISMSDGPHGLRHQTGEENYSNINDSRVATCFPTASAIAASWNRKSAEKMARAIALEAKAENVQIMLGPGMNIKRSPLCGRNFEYFSEDPLLSGELASSYVKGMQNENVGACIKHFALNNQEKNRQSSSSNVDERTLREIYLKGFEIAVKKSKPVSIMSSYNLINGKYASANKQLLTQILRDEWKFDGIVISDWGANMNPVESLKAGMDLGMPDSFGYFQKRLNQDFSEGRITEADIDSACHRIIEKAVFFEEQKGEFASGEKCEKVDFEKQHECALELALDSAVLLKNDGIFPLKIAEKNSSDSEIVVIGELAQNIRFQGGGSSHITTKTYPNILEELSSDFDVSYEAGYVSTFCPSKKKTKRDAVLRKNAVQLVKDSLKKNPEIPVLFFCGLYESSEGEGFDRADLKLPEEQVELYKEIRSLTKNVVFVTFGGSPFDLSFAYEKEFEVRAILHMYLCGEACAKATEMLICGKANPCGKVAETWPTNAEKFAPKDNFDINYEEGVKVGYRYYETEKIPVLYEFGFGLSYTKFEYTNLKIEKVEKSPELFKVSLDVENAGNRDGSEIVQLYVRNPASPKGITRPSIELRDFAKINLAKGEKSTVEFVLTEDAFSVYSDKCKSWGVVGGEYEICAASSVRDIRLCKKVEIAGESLENLVSEDVALQEKAFVKHEQHKKGQFTLSDSLKLMAKESRFIRNLLKLLEFLLVITSENKSADDPAVKITIYGLEENPLESLISTAPQVFSEKLCRWLVKKANGHR